jgi:hypothetical protein
MENQMLCALIKYLRRILRTVNRQDICCTYIYIISTHVRCLIIVTFARIRSEFRVKQNMRTMDECSEIVHKLLHSTQTAAYHT